MEVIPYLLNAKWASHHIQEILLNTPGVREQVCVCINFFTSGRMGVAGHECSSNVWNVKFFFEISANKCLVSASIDGLNAIVTFEITREIDSEVPLRKCHTIHKLLQLLYAS
jgi:hypothetical protein